MSTPDPMAEIRASFFMECEELLEAMQDSLQQMDDGTHDGETIHVLFRAVHSIKGGAGAFGLEELVRFAHRYESVLDVVRGGRVGVDSALLNLFFRAADHLSDLVRASRDDDDFPTVAGNTLLVELDAIVSAPAGDETAEPEIEFEPMALSLDLDQDLETDHLGDVPDVDGAPEIPNYKIRFVPHPDMYETGNDAFPVLQALSRLGDCIVECDTSRLPDFDVLVPEIPYLAWDIFLISDVDEAEIYSTFEFVEGLCDLHISRDGGATAPDTQGQISATPEIAAEPEPDTVVIEPDTSAPPDNPAKPDVTKAPAAAAKSIVRVDLDRIERLVNLVGELVINQAMLAQSLQSVGLSPHSNAMSGMEEFQRLTRDIQDSVMMIRAQPVKSLFQRMSRIVREATTTVDKDARLVTEGETTEVDKTLIERIADPLTHMVRNAVDHGLETTQARLDAGKPAQGQVHLRAAHKSGRVVIEVADDGGGIDRNRVQQIAIKKGLISADAVLTDNEIDNLLFLPGFSTADAVSDLSGRGVGMDVVRTAVQALGGRISITSVPGIGTTFSISLPLTLAVLDGMVVEVADETVVLPLNVVMETLTLSADLLDSIQPGVEVVRTRGGFVPLYDLGQMLGYRDKLDSYVDYVALMVMHEDGCQYALIVDEIQDQRQVVIKGLDETFYRAPGIAAATILGDGKIALILDTSDIISQVADANRGAATYSQMEA